jgi:hypothetical protein
MSIDRRTLLLHHAKATAANPDLLDQLRALAKTAKVGGVVGPSGRDGAQGGTGGAVNEGIGAAAGPRGRGSASDGRRVGQTAPTEPPEGIVRAGGGDGHGRRNPGVFGRDLSADR